MNLNPEIESECCHAEPFACHSERSEESLQFAQGKLREASLQIVAGCQAQKITAEILRPDKSGLRMTGGFNFGIGDEPACGKFLRGKAELEQRMVYA